MSRAMPCLDCAACETRLSGVFSQLDPNGLERLSRTKASRVYERGQMLFYEGNPCAGVFCVKSGLAKVYKEAPHDRSYILYLAGPGDVLGLESVVSGTVHTATAEMLEDGAVCQIDPHDLAELIGAEPGLQRTVLRLLSRQLIEANEERTELAAGEVRERLALTLLALAERYGAVQSDGIRLKLNLSREDLAELIGATTETTIRHLSELRTKDIVHTSGREIVIHDTARLARIARIPVGNLR